MRAARGLVSAMGAGAKRGLVVAGLLTLLAVAIWLWLRGNGMPRTHTGTVPGAAHEDEPTEVTRVRAPTPTRTAAVAASAYAPPTHTLRDKVVREQARQRIFQALGSGESDPRGSTAAPAPAPTLDKDYIQTRIREDFVPMAKECYEAALERDAGLAGKMVFRFAIVGDENVGGIVESAELDPSSTLAESELVTCMRESLLSVTFVPPEHGGRVTVTYPFVLSPDDGG